MVHFVGAGCGATDLITLRGKRLLERADVIIYAGSLVNDELLGFAKPGCRFHNSAEMTLEDVIAVIKKAEAEGKETVRLHSGDPSIYGAIKEQMRDLDSLGVAYDVCPGVSSFCGAAAALKAEYTLPDVSQTVIITRVEGRTPMPPREKLAALAAHQATMVLFLSAGLADKTQEGLLEGGYSPETPVAIVYKATWDDEKIYYCTVATISETVKENNVTKTALITVGNFLGENFSRSKLYYPHFATEYRAAQ